jgi:hypothetical protein
LRNIIYIRQYLGDPDNNNPMGVELAVNVVVGSMRGINEGRGMPLSLLRGFLRGYTYTGSSHQRRGFWR